MPKITRTIDQDSRELAMKLYLDGMKLADIEERTGVGRGNLYEWLKQAGIAPKRTNMAARTGTVGAQTIQWAFNKLLEQEREIGELQAEVRRLTVLLDAYMTTPANGTRKPASRRKVAV